MTWQIEVSTSCIGSGMCAGAAPDYFELRDGYSEALRSEVAPADEVLDAAESCPVEAILVRDKETGRVLAPEG